MAREKELYRDTLARTRELVDRLYPGRLVLNQKEVAAMLGVSVKTLRNRGLIGTSFTAEQIASKIC